MIEIVPGSRQHSAEFVADLDETHDALLSYGFDECRLLLPTKGFHGTRVELYADLNTEPELPFIKPVDFFHNTLAVSTLSGIAFDIDITTGRAPRPIIPSKFLGGIVIDKEIKDSMVKLAEVGTDLALQGFGYLGERVWIKPIEPIEGAIQIKPTNEVRYLRLKNEVEALVHQRQAFWAELGWNYSITPLGTHDGISLWRWLDHNPEEGSVDDIMQIIECSRRLRVTGRISPDVGVGFAIDPVGPLSLEELAQLQEDAKAEFESGALSDYFLSLKR